jgi:hypothetical protein
LRRKEIVIITKKKTMEVQVTSTGAMRWTNVGASIFHCQPVEHMRALDALTPLSNLYPNGNYKKDGR